jgi:zinc transport system permease protein
MLTDWINHAIDAIVAVAPEGSFFWYAPFVRGFIAVFLVAIVCGGVGSMVVGNRMAFFSDALAHCAYAGVSLGLLTAYVEHLHDRDGPFFQLGIPAIMVGFGALVGVGIAFVRERTGLASDTVIGVFFAAALGFSAIMLPALRLKLGYFDLEQFLFGNLMYVDNNDLVLMILLMLISAAFLVFLYNPLVFTSFNPSLARSRRVPLRLCSYLFVVLIALLVNLCLRIVGVMLINALLIVPAATSALLARNMRQMFWGTVGVSLIAGLGGQAIGWEVSNGLHFQVGLGGPIVVLAVALFVLAMAVRPLLRGQQATT